MQSFGVIRTFRMRNTFPVLFFRTDADLDMREVLRLHRAHDALNSFVLAVFTSDTIFIVPSGRSK